MDQEQAPDPELLAAQLSTREISRFVRYYDEKIRRSSKTDKLGIFKIIQGTLKKGITPEMIQIALENYYTWAQTRDVRYRKPIRSFFTEVTIREWQTPLRPNQAPRNDKKSGPRDGGLDALEALEQTLF